MNAVLKTDIKEFPLLARGKVRDIYDLGDKLLIVATDRISAFDYILPTPIPGKGIILNSISLFWFSFTSGIIPNHLYLSDINSYPQSLQKYSAQLAGRSMIVRKALRIDIECVARGYLVGSGYKDYQNLLKANPNATSVDLYGNIIPANLRMADKLPRPIFTPATKEESGHDQNISFDQMATVVGYEVAARLRDTTLDIYSQANEYANKRGIIIADTKFEFGFIDGQLSLIDEILSPDSSRFWPIDSYAPGS
ncbi:MAG TPA: phosphoribosylaminoimidazolesuccinocarboxamide synthase, partial [candidate division Zixibacteria bacterium]|nr:phosphoribosylaminoimidazolesuccinocarboxamide synthase [candidate division Zixibacteria bacterium]